MKALCWKKIMRIIALEKDNHYTSKTKNNSNNSETMQKMHIIGSEKIIPIIHLKSNKTYNSLQYK